MKFRLTHDCLLQIAIVVLLAAGVTAFATSALAANADYEDQALGAVTPGTPLVFDIPLYVQALADSEVTDGVACAPNCPNNGTKYQLNYGSGFAGSLAITGEPIPVSCTPEDCSPFDLIQIDVAEPLPDSGPVSMIFFGTTAGGDSLEFNFETDGVMDGAGGQPDFETVVLPDTFRDLASVLVIDAAPYQGVAIDNIVVEPAVQPVPALAPFGLGALALVLCASATWLGRTRATAR
jgi:hypothetical protein